MNKMRWLNLGGGRWRSEDGRFTVSRNLYGTWWMNDTKLGRQDAYLMLRSAKREAAWRVRDTPVAAFQDGKRLF